MKKLKKNKLYPWIGLLRSIVATILLVLAFRSFIAEAYVIPSGSMKPGLQIGDRLFVNKFIYGLRVPGTTLRIVDGANPRRGEVVVFTDPKDGHTTLIKRVIAVGGDTVEMKNNQVYLNGKAILRHKELGPCQTKIETDGFAQHIQCKRFKEHLGDRQYTVFQFAGFPQYSFGPVKVPKNHFFVLGDNRDNSNDSRYWGNVPMANLKGRAMFIYWSHAPDGVHWNRMLQSIQ